MYRMTIAYPGTADDRCDFDYYTSKHMPMVADFLGDNCTRHEITRGIASGAGGAAPWVATGAFWISSLEGMQEAMQQHGREIMGDIKNYTDLEPVVQIEEVTTVAEPV